jgi:branched-chain amino acid transport system ATP-binding protein
MLTVKDLSVSYGQIAAVKGISFEVPKGKIVTLIGANGAGKTTTLRAVSGLERASGSISLDGREIINEDAHKIVALGLCHVPEGRKIFSTLTVSENLDMAAWLLRDAVELKRRKERVYAMFPRLAERRSQLGGTLSGGEQQMLAVGRAIVTGGAIVLLDEPSMGLAPVLVDEIFATIVALNRDGITVLLVEQNARQALEIAHYAYVLETGSITLHGEASAIAEDGRVKEAYLGV